MSFTPTDLQNINAAIATGELSVEVNGRKVVYRNMDDLIKARNLMQADMAAVGASAAAPRRGSFQVRFTTARGD